MSPPSAPPPHIFVPITSVKVIDAVDTLARYLRSSAWQRGGASAFLIVLPGRGGPRYHVFAPGRFGRIADEARAEGAFGNVRRLVDRFDLRPADRAAALAPGDVPRGPAVVLHDGSPVGVALPVAEL